MPSWRHLAHVAVFTIWALAGTAIAPASGEPQTIGETTRALDDARALTDAQTQEQQAGRRAELLETRARRANAIADRTAQQAAAAAARIQQAEAEVAQTAAQLRLTAIHSAALHADVAKRQQPLMRLIAALQLQSRRPMALALFRPGSVIDIVHTRALIETTIPEVQRRTAALRAEIARGDMLRCQLQAARLALRREEQTLAGRRQTLAALETQQRLAARDVTGSADREAERALAISEQARDLGALINGLRRADDLSAPPRLPRSSARATPVPLPGYIRPLTGRLVAGFGDIWHGERSRGISIATEAGAQVVSPAAGRVAFSGPYRGYDRIVIVTHGGGWTSLITGLAELDVRVGDTLVAGSPLGSAGPGRPVLTLELRHDGKIVNPTSYINN